MYSRNRLEISVLLSISATTPGQQVCLTELWGAGEAKEDGEKLIFTGLLVLPNEAIDWLGSVLQSCAHSMFFS